MFSRVYNQSPGNWRHFFSCSILSVMCLCMAQLTEAQTRRYAERGGDSSASNNCTNPANPCSLSRAFNAASDLQTVAVRLRAAGEKIEIHDGVDISVSQGRRIRLAGYERIDPTTNVGGTLVLRDDLQFHTVDSEGWVSYIIMQDDFQLHVKNATITARGYEEYPLVDGDEDEFIVEDSKIVLTDTPRRYGCPGLGYLTTRGTVTIEGACDSSPPYYLDATRYWLSDPTFSSVSASGRTEHIPLDDIAGMSRSDLVDGLYMRWGLKVEGDSLIVKDGLNLHLYILHSTSNYAKRAVTIEEGAVLTADRDAWLQIAVDTDFAQNTENCFRIRGKGTLAMRWARTTTAGVCIEVPRLTARNASINMADGPLFVTNAAEIVGDFVNDNNFFLGRHRVGNNWNAGTTGNPNNRGFARTEFWNLLRLRGDLTIFSDARVQRNAVPAGWCPPDQELGVHLYQGTTIDGNVIFEDVPFTSTPTGNCSAGLYLQGADDPDDRGSRSAFLDLTPTIYTTIKGDIEVRSSTPASLGGYIYFDDHNFLHNLILEGDLVMEDAIVFFDLSIAYYLNAANLPQIMFSRCGETPYNDYYASFVMMRGPQTQTIFLPTGEGLADFGLGGLVVDKRGGLVRIQGPENSMTVDVLDFRGGTILTGSSAGSKFAVSNGLAMRHGAGGNETPSFIADVGQSQLFVRNDYPEHLLYYGNGKAEIGPEVAGSLNSLTVMKTGGANLHVKRPLVLRNALQLVAGKLVMHRVEDEPVAGSGWVHPEDEGNATISLADGFANIRAYSGDIDYDATNPGSIRVSEDAWENPNSDAPILRYVGGRNRTLGNLVPGASSYRTARRQDFAYRELQIDSACRAGIVPAHPIISLNDDYTVFYEMGRLTLDNGALDLKGGLLNFVNFESNLTIETDDTGILCNSSIGQSCNAVDPDDDVAGFSPARRDTTLTARKRFERYAQRLQSKNTPVGKNRVLITESSDSTSWIGEGDPGSQVALFNMLGRNTTLPDIDLFFPTTNFRFNGTRDDEKTSVTMPWLVVGAGVANFRGNIDEINVEETMLVDGRVNVHSPEVAADDKRTKVNANFLWVRHGGVGDFRCADISTASAYVGRFERLDPANASLRIGSAGRLEVKDWLYTAPDMANNRPSEIRLSDPCRSPNIVIDEAPVGIFVQGEMDHHGSGDVRNRANANENGLRGQLTFTGDTEVIVADGSNSQLGNVTINTDTPKPGTITLLSNVVQHSEAALTLTRGYVEPDLGEWEWHILKTDADTMQSGDSSPKPGSGTVSGGSRYAYMRDIPLSRALGSSPVITTTGYFFPAGLYRENDDNTRTDVFRPLTLQVTSGASAFDTLVVLPQNLPAESLDWPGDNLAVPGESGTLTLDNYAEVFWTVWYDGPEGHALTGNLRLAASDLANVNDIRGLRIVRWNCDGSNPQLAGRYDLGQDDGDVFDVNAFINGVANITHGGVTIGACNIFGIASNFAQNPISLPPVTSGFARVQLVNTSTASFNLFVDQRRVVNNWGAGSATPYLPIPSGVKDLALAHPADRTGANPIVQMPVRLAPQQDYIVILHGDTTALGAIVQQDARLIARNDEKVDLLIAHTATDRGAVDVRLLDDRDNTSILRSLSNNLAYGRVSPYVSVDPLGYNIEVSTDNNAEQLGIYRAELDQYEGEALLLALVNTQAGLGVMSVNALGQVEFPAVITDTDEQGELPQRFVLHSNYPNPFNPSTRIVFDLPAPSEMTIQVIDLLGRLVMEVTPGQVEAGFNRTIELNAVNLASGTYFYRVIAETPAGRHTDTGRMVFVK